MMKMCIRDRVRYALTITDERRRKDYLEFSAKWQSRNYRNTYISDAQSVYPIAMSEFDRNVYYLNCQNGTLDLQTGEFHPHTPQDKLTKIAGAAYDPNAKNPRFTRFVSVSYTHLVVSEAKHQGKDIENIKAGKLVGKNNNQDLMAAGNAIERAYKNVNEIANFMLSENYFPYILFLEGSNFLTQNVIVTRPDGRKVTLVYNDGMLNRLDRLTAANYGMPINTNLCENRFVKCNLSLIHIF